MAVSKTHSPKMPSQNPVDFYKSKQQGGAYGKPSSVPQELKGGPMREQINGRKGLWAAGRTFHVKRKQSSMGSTGKDKMSKPSPGKVVAKKIVGKKTEPDVTPARKKLYGKPI